MTELGPDEKDSAVINRLRDYLANERTFLAWIRTSIGIMAFGFVVEKFAFFLKKISFFLASDASAIASHSANPNVGSSSILGIILVVLGTLICLLAYIRYKRVESQIDQGKYERSFLLEVMLTLSLLAIGICQRLVQPID